MKPEEPLRRYDHVPAKISVCDNKCDVVIQFTQLNIFTILKVHIRKNILQNLMRVILSGGNGYLYSNEERFCFDDRTMYFGVSILYNYMDISAANFCYDVTESTYVKKIKARF